MSIWDLGYSCYNNEAALESLLKYLNRNVNNIFFENELFYYIVLYKQLSDELENSLKSYVSAEFFEEDESCIPFISDVLEDNFEVPELYEHLKNYSFELYGYFIDPEYYFEALFRPNETSEEVINNLIDGFKYILESSQSDIAYLNSFISKYGYEGFENEQSIKEYKETFKDSYQYSLIQLFKKLFSNIESIMPKDKYKIDITVDFMELLSGILYADDESCNIDAFNEIINWDIQNLTRNYENFGTVNEINELMSQLVLSDRESNSIDSAYDGFLGTGMSLLNLRSKVLIDNMVGCEINENIYRFALINAFINGYSYDKILQEDSIFNKNLLSDTFEVIISQVPFNPRGKLGFKDRESLELFEKMKFDKNPSNSEWVYILSLLNNLDDSGIMVNVVSQGALFKSTDKQFREHVLEKNCLDTVINLPNGLLKSSNVPMSILIFKKDKSNEEVFFIDASNEYESLRGFNRLREEDIERIVESFLSKSIIEKFSNLSNLDEIRKNDFNLNISRYVDTFDEDIIKLEDIGEDIKKLNDNLEETNKKIDDLLLDLSLDEKLKF